MSLDEEALPRNEQTNAASASREVSSSAVRGLEPARARFTSAISCARSAVASYTEPLGRGREMYRKFRDKQDGCIKVVLKP